MSLQFLLGSLFGLLIAVGSYFAQFLTLSGSIATLCLATIIFGIGGWQWAVPIVTFFVLSSVLSKCGQSRKRQFDQIFEKSGRRDWGQVVANGGVAGSIVVVSAFFPVYDFYPLYLGALAAATADTWGTEIGILSKGKTVSVLTLQLVEVGSSGGVSEAGTIGGALGAAIVALSGYLWYTELRTTIIVIAAGVVGSLVDSLVGATLQSQFRCEICGKTTEKRMHCGEPTSRIRGVQWIGNDVVNGFCTAIGALVAWGVLLLF